jgi:hypothetical protein
VRAINANDPPKAQIEPSTHERRRDRHANQIYQKRVVAEGILVQHETANVPDDLGGQAKHEGDAEAPGFVAEGVNQVREEADDEEGDDDDVPGEGGAVADLSKGHVTGVESALMHVGDLHFGHFGGDENGRRRGGVVLTTISWDMQRETWKQDEKYRA